MRCRRRSRSMRQSHDAARCDAPASGSCTRVTPCHSFDGSTDRQALTSGPHTVQSGTMSLPVHRLHPPHPWHRRAPLGLLALVLGSATGAGAQAPATASTDREPPTACCAEVTVRAPLNRDHAIWTEKLTPPADRSGAVKPPTGLRAEAIAQRPGNTLGLVNLSATGQRMGNTFGHSVLPQRP